VGVVVPIPTCAQASPTERSRKIRLKKPLLLRVIGIGLSDNGYGSSTFGVLIAGKVASHDEDIGVFWDFFPFLSSAVPADGAFGALLTPPYQEPPPIINA
jgi:hypothetical protein